MSDEIKCCACGKNAILEFNKIGWTKHGRLWECPSCGYTASVGSGHIELKKKMKMYMQPDDLDEDVRKLS